MKRQLDTLLEAFERGERLTVCTALNDYGIYALSQRVGELRRQGYPIHGRTITTANGKHVSEYALASQGELLECAAPS